MLGEVLLVGQWWYVCAHHSDVIDEDVPELLEALKKVGTNIALLIA